MTDEQLSALLRLKRYEQPPAKYFDQLLHEIHRRQRAELLRRPLWKIAVERAQTFFGEHSMGHVSYAGAMAAVLVVGVAAIGWLTPATGGSRQEAEIVATAHADAEKIAPAEADRVSLSLQASAAAPRLEAWPPPVTQPRPSLVVRQPRDGMDARPVSYEPSSSFNF